MDVLAITSILVLTILGVIARKKIREEQAERNHYGNYVMMGDEDIEHFKSV